MTTAVIGTGGIGSVIARQLASGGETLRLSSADHTSAQMLAAGIGGAAVVAADNRDALRGAGAVVLALRFAALKGVIDEIDDPLTEAGARLAMAFGTLPADLFRSASSRSPEPAGLFYVTDDERAGEEVERFIRTAGFEPVKAGGIDQSSRLEVGGDLHDLVVGPAAARSVIGAA
jgi:predicted dinucleotide-binding enzyme